MVETVQICTYSARVQRRKNARKPLILTDTADLSGIYSDFPPRYENWGDSSCKMVIKLQIQRELRIWDKSPGTISHIANV